MAEVVEDRLINLRIGGAEALAKHEDDLTAELGRAIEELHERLARDEDELRRGERGRTGASGKAVEKRHLADDLAVFEEVDGRFAAVLCGQVDAKDARDDDVEPVRFVTLLEENVVRLQRHFAGDARQSRHVVRIEAVEEDGPPEPGGKITARHRAKGPTRLAPTTGLSSCGGPGEPEEIAGSGGTRAGESPRLAMTSLDIGIVGVSQ